MRKQKLTLFLIFYLIMNDCCEANVFQREPLQLLGPAFLNLQGDK